MDRFVLTTLHQHPDQVAFIVQAPVQCAAGDIRGAGDQLERGRSEAFSAMQRSAASSTSLQKRCSRSLALCGRAGLDMAWGLEKKRYGHAGFATSTRAWQIAQQLAISSNSSDLLSSLLPAYTPSRGKMNGSGETLRGRTPLILVDGIPQSNPLRPTGREAHTIDYAMVERIEVIQGANAIRPPGISTTGA